MSVINHLEWRYATKKFDPAKIITQEKLNVLKQSFNLTATSFGLQTVKLVFVEDTSIRERLVAHSFGQKQVAQASHLMVLCIQADITDHDVDLLFDDIAETRNTPETILKPYREDLRALMRSKSVRERQEWSIKQAYIILGSLMTVCAIEEIDACPMEGFVQEKYDELLGLKELNLKSVLLLPVGYRAADDMFAAFKKVRKNLDDVIVSI